MPTVSITYNTGNAVSIANTNANFKSLKVAVDYVLGLSIGSGTVTSVGLTMPNVFSVASSPVTTTGTLAVTLATQTANTIFSGPTTGSAATPAFRVLVANDLPVVTVAKGGTALTAVGTAYQLLGTNSGATAYTHLTLASANTKITVAGAGTTITLTVNEANLNVSAMTNGTLAIANGGTGATTALAARLALLPSRTALYYLRVNAGNNDVEWVASPGGITTLNGLTSAAQPSQTFSVGATDATAFVISSATSTHTFLINPASAVQGGLMTTGTQTIAGAKTFSGAFVMSSTLTVATSVTVTGLTATRVLFAGAAGLITDDADLTFITGTNTLTTVNVAATTAITSATLATTGQVTVGGAFVGTTDTRTGAGAISLTTLNTKLITTGAGEAITLADGADGQIKIITMIVDGGDGVLTCATKQGFATTITFNDAGDSVMLEFATTYGWRIISNTGCTV